VNRERKSLILITVDCLRADHCGFYGYGRATTPFLDSLASGSIVVPTAVVAGAPTYYSLPAIFASRMPLALGRDVIGLAPGEETLATALHGAGYSTAAFSAANPYISARLGFAQGFGEFRDFLDFDRPPSGDGNADDELQRENRNAGQIRNRQTINRWLKKSAQTIGAGKLYDELYFQYLVRIAASPVSSMDAVRKYPSAEMVIEAARAWLETVESRPFFLWLHLMDPHAPYYPPPRAFQQLMGKEISPERARYLNEFWNRSDVSAAGLRRKREAVVDLYDASIRWADGQIAAFVEYLKRTNRWDDCVFALTADHGEEFLEHGGRFHVPVSLGEEIVRVPLLIRAPRGVVAAGAAHSSDPFSLLHLAPTLLDILGVPSPPSFRGTSRWGKLREGSGAGQLSGDRLPSNHLPDNAVTELVYKCSNPFRREMRLSPRMLSVRDGRYKLVIKLEADSVEQLYDLRTDPTERNPLPRGEGSEIRKRLLQAATEELGKTIAERPVAPRLRTLLRELRLELSS
jgi:arylsulfatase A-like enzyme